MLPTRSRPARPLGQWLAPLPCGSARPAVGPPLPTLDETPSRGLRWWRGGEPDRGREPPTAPPARTAAAVRSAAIGRREVSRPTRKDNSSPAPTPDTNPPLYPLR